MKHPPYHLRSAKGVDRFLLVEMLKRLCPLYGGSSKYRYVGFGGPFLEDFKLVDYFFPEMKLVSLESNLDTFKRQNFHRFNRRIKLLHKTDVEYIEGGDEGQLIALWLDYTNCKPEYFSVLTSAVQKAAAGSLVRLTLSARVPQAGVEQTRFLEDFDQLLPVEKGGIFNSRATFNRTLVHMVRAATIPTLGEQTSFLVINGAVYEDGARMATITGIKVEDAHSNKVVNAFRDWPFCINGDDPTNIELPELSMAERMKLGRLLPAKTNGSMLRRSLGYLVDIDEATTNSGLQNYAAFARYQPVFARLHI